MHIVQESMLFKGEMEAMVLENCRDPSFELVTKIRVYKGASRKGNVGITFYAPGNVGGCERMNPHTPKWAPTLGVRIPMNS